MKVEKYESRERLVVLSFWLRQRELCGRSLIIEYFVNCCTQIAEIENDQAFFGQATKGRRRMPGYREAKKDVVSCDKLRGAANRL